MSSMHRKALTLALLVASAAAVGAAIAPVAPLKLLPAAVQTTASVPAPAAPAPYRPPSYAVAPQISSALAQWKSLRQSDGQPFSSYASFLTRHRGWPGETGLRKTAERAISPATSASEVVSYFRVHPPLSAVGHARHAFALSAAGQPDRARQAAREAWHAGLLPRQDEDRLLSEYGSALTPLDHDRRMETLLNNGDTLSAQRTLPYASAARRAIFDARIALQTRASDASSKLAMIGASANNDAGVLADRANWLRAGGQSLAARNLLATRPALASRPHDAETWFETMLTMARAAANDKQWTTAYQISSKLDDAFAPGTDVSGRSTGERDDYTSLAWLAGNTALHNLGRPADAIGMFTRYAKGGRSSQVSSKGYYWAGRAAIAAGRAAEANGYFSQAARYPELFYGQLALERLGQAVPAPSAIALVSLTDADRSEFQRRDMVQAARLLGQMGQWQDQSLFVRTLSENVDNVRDRALASELSRVIGRPDLAVWVARSARNSGTPFYTRLGYPEARIPATQNQYWSLAHGIMRQESSFDRAAMSPVGARGMMQLMPGTARETSGKLGLSYDLGRLTSDPDYNIMLGTRYFAGLMNSWGGNAPLAVASYNAGAGNVRKWLAANGDPRMPNVDIVRWIEEIPFSETRGYVQRVLENAVVYDAINPSRARTPERTRLSYYLGKSNRPG
jgi:soluble lytic murein transglycosylase